MGPHSQLNISLRLAIIHLLSTVVKNIL
jgi:hypothetical protein